MELLVRLLIAALVIWLTQVLLGVFEVKQPANKIILVIVVILVVLWLLGLGLFLR